MFTATVERSEDVVVGLDVDDEPLWVEVEEEGWMPACLYCGGPCERPMSHVQADFGLGSDDEAETRVLDDMLARLDVLTFEEVQ